MNFQTGMVRQNTGTKELEQKKGNKWVPASSEVKNAFASDKVTFQNSDEVYHYYMYQFSESKARTFLEAHAKLIFPDISKVNTNEEMKAGYLIAATGKNAKSYKIAEWIWKDGKAIINIINVREPLSSIVYDEDAFDQTKDDRVAVGLANEYQEGGFDFAYEDMPNKSKRIPCKEMDVKTVYNWLINNM